MQLLKSGLRKDKLAKSPNPITLFIQQPRLLDDNRGFHTFFTMGIDSAINRVCTLGYRYKVEVQLTAIGHHFQSGEVRRFDLTVFIGLCLTGGNRLIEFRRGEVVFFLTRVLQLQLVWLTCFQADLIMAITVWSGKLRKRWK